jgi:hypothetical protein
LAAVPSPLRLAFVGQSTFFAACVPTLDDDEVVTTFIEFREGFDTRPMRAALDAFAPDAVVLFRPEVVPPGVMADVGAPIVGFLTEPVPRSVGGRHHADLAKRGRDLERLDPANLDRLVSFDPMIVPVAERVFPVWRSLPIPVADRLYADVPAEPAPPRLVFVGRSTPHRESYLQPVKREFDLLHVAFGAGVEELARLMRENDTTVNLHNEPYPSFENRVCLHLAAGHLVITEPLSPTHGLVPGEDIVEIHTPDELLGTLRDVRRDPGRFLAIRRSGRAKAEEYRASAVFPALARDLLDETGGQRRPSRERSALARTSTGSA